MSSPNHQFISSNEFQKFLLRKFATKEEFLKSYRSQYSEKGKSEGLYFEALQSMVTAIEAGKAEDFKKVYSKFGYMSSVEDQDELKKYFENEKNPLKATNLMIAACKHNRLEILSYVLGNSGNLKFFYPKINLNDEDEFSHNAIYYAILSNDVKMLDTLLNKWPDNSHLPQLDDILSKPYEELRGLKNVNLSEEIIIYIENILVDKRFFSKNSGIPKDLSIDISKIEKRIEFLLETVNLLNLKSDKIDQEFLYIMRSIIFNISTLKRFLKSTYNELPWEEIEFCLTCFVISHTRKQEINFFTISYLKTSDVLKHLTNFAKHLTRVKNNLPTFDVKKIAVIPGMSRNQVMSNILKTSPEFEDLYSAFQKIRDIHSLESIVDYINLATSVDCKEQEGQLIITRTLQMIGENLKNTLESPKLSDVVSELLLLSLSNNTRKIIKNLRNSLSHANSLSKREELENNRDVRFFNDIQNDIKKIGIVIDQILVDNKIKALKEILRRLQKINDVNEVKEELKNFNKFDLNVKTAMDDLKAKKSGKSQFNMEMPKSFLGLKNSAKLQFSETDEIQKLVKEMQSKIPEKTFYDTKQFDEIFKILESKQTKLNDTKENYEIAFLEFQGLKLGHKLFNGKNDLRQIKFVVNQALQKLSSKTEEQSKKDIAHLTQSIFKSCSSRLSEKERDEINFIVLKIQCKAELGLNSINKIEYMQDILTTNDKSKKHSKQIDYQDILDKKMTQLKEILDNYELSDKLHDNFVSFRTNQKLKVAVEMLVLDILSILCESNNILENNLLSFEEFSPVLVGKNLRNHLAHDNFIVNLLENAELNTYLNVQKILSGNLLKSCKMIGKLTEDDPEKLKNQFYDVLNLVKTQEEMFASLKTGRLNEVKGCLSQGAEIKAKDVQNSTALHLACESNNLPALKFVLSSHTFDPEFCNNLGEAPLHIAARQKNSEKIVEYLIDKAGIPVDCLNGKLETALHVASDHGHVKLVKLLLKFNADTNRKDVGSWAALHHAITYNHLDVVKVLMEKEKSVDSNEAVIGFTCLHVAAEYGYTKLVEYLLENGANPNAESDQKAIPLQLASLNGHLECVIKLISAKSNVNHTGYNGCSSLHFATENNHNEIAKILLENGAKVNVYDHTFAQSPIFYAAQNGNVPLIDLFVKYGAVVNEMRNDKMTPIMFSVINGHEKAVKVLLKYGAKTVFDHLQTSALHLVQENGNIDIVKILVDNNIDLNLKDSLGKTPLHAYCAHEYCYDAIEFLISLKADVNAKDSTGATPIFYAISNGNKAIVELLIRNNAEVVDVSNKYSITPFYTACLDSQKNVCEILKILLDHGCDVNSKVYLNATPLHFSVMSKNVSAVEFLINNHANIDSPDSSGITPVMLAIQTNQSEIAKLLIGNGAALNVNIIGKNKHLDLLTIAVKQNNVDMVKLVLKDNSITFNYEQAITAAIFTKNYKIFEILLEKCTNVNSDPDLPCLHLACVKNLKDFASALISKGCDVNSVDKKISTLRAAVEVGSYDCAELLLDNGANIDYVDHEGSTPLIIAASFGHADVVKLLLERGADVSIRDHKFRSAFEMAVARSHLNVVKVFFEMKKVAINDKGKENWTALHVACNSNDLEIVKCLLDNGYDVHTMNDRGTKPIHYASRDGFTEILKHVLKSKLCKVDDMCFGNFTLLYYAVAGNQFETTKFLIESGANVNLINLNGETPLHVAATGNFKSLVQYLLENGAIFNSIDMKLKTPSELASSSDVKIILTSTEKLFKAVKQNNLEEVKLQLKNGGIINAKNVDGFTCIHYACWKGFYDIVNLLLENGGNPNAIGNNGLSPLHYASKFSHFKLVILLLKNGAIFNLSSESGKTPLDFALDNKDTKNILTLIEKALKAVKNGNTSIKDEIYRIKDKDTIKAIMNAKNKKGNTLIVEALIHKYPKVDDLKSVLQDNPYQKINLSTKLVTTGQYQESMKVLNTLYAQRVDIFGPENPAVYEIELHLAKVIYKQGDYQRALAMHERLYEKFKTILGANNKETLDTKSGIALVLHRLGRNEEALKIFRVVYKKQKELLGEFHEDTMNSYLHMALVLDHLGKYEEALFINQFIYQVRLITSGAMDQGTIAAQNNVAMVLGNLERIDESIKMYEDVHNKKKIVYGEHYADTLKTLFVMTLLKGKASKYKDTLPTLYDLHKVQKDVLGPFHPDTLNTQFQIGSLLLNQNKFIAAYKVIQENQERMKIVFGPTHIFNMKHNSMMQLIELRNQFSGDLINLKSLQNQFFSACSDGQLDLIKHSLKCGQNVDEIDEEGRNGLQFAVSGDQEEVVKYLLRAGIDAIHSSYKGNTALHISCTKNNLKLTEILIQHVKAKNRKKLNEFINYKTANSETTAMHIAAKNNSFDLIKILLKNGAIYNLKNKNNQLPIDISNNQTTKNFLKLIDNVFIQVKLGNSEILKTLKDLSVEEFSSVINARNNLDLTILQVAISNKHKQIVSGLSELLKLKV